MAKRRKRSRGARLGEAVTTVTDLKYKVKRCGSHFLDRDTMRFFKSRVHNTYADRTKNATCFVTSEQGPDNIRRLTVRKFKNCKVESVSEFQQYPNTRDGRMMANSAASRACGGAKSGAGTGFLGRRR